MQSGKINVQTENIFPIIKKFLYSDHEIFLRELVSNAVDATQKLNALAKMGEFKGELGDTAIEIAVDKKKKTISIKDKGLGMTSAEVEKYINQVAFSGAEEFVNKYKDKTDVNNIIGHFGLGFYSSFMVASKVEIITKSYKDEKGVIWECDGSPDYKIEEHKKKSRGTEIILHIADDSDEFLESMRIQTLLTKYCKFLPVEIKFEDKVINNTQPAWTKAPASLTDEDYKKFYKELYPYSFEDPLFYIHLNVDYPFNLTGILYFPKIKQRIEVQKDKIQLYSRQVFITDSVENIVPDFLMLLRGVLDSPDIPLNVSRSYLQSDANVKKISSHITKKVADKLEDLFKKDRKDFESKWEDIKVFIEYGMLSEEKFNERAQKFALLKTTDNKLYTIEEFTEKIKPIQTNKENRLIYLYTTNSIEQHSYIETARGRGYEVLVLDSPIDSHFVNFIETKLESASFVRVDADTIDKLINKEEALPSKLTEEQQNSLKPIVEKVVPKEKFTVVFESLSEKDNPILITQPEFMRRMKDMSAMGGGGMGFMGTPPEMYNLVVNSNHPLISKIITENDAIKQEQLTKQAADLALLSQNLLKGEELTKFIKRSLDLIA
jgi:molecular chaperone HtpG